MGAERKPIRLHQDPGPGRLRGPDGPVAGCRPAGFLLVEDNDGHACLVESNLRRFGIDNPIHRVGDGEEALQFLDRAAAGEDRESVGPLVVILDLGLPRTDGFEVLRSAKANPRLQNNPVVVLTTSENPDDIQRCYDLGCDCCTSKWAVFSTFDEFAELMRRYAGLAESAHDPVD